MSDKPAEPEGQRPNDVPENPPGQNGPPDPPRAPDNPENEQETAWTWIFVIGAIIYEAIRASLK